MSNSKTPYVFWSLVSIGVLPAISAALLPPGQFCLDASLQTRFFCQLSIERASFATKFEFGILYLVLLALGVLIALTKSKTKFWSLISLSPLLLLSLISLLTLSITPTPLPQSVFASNDEVFEDGVLDAKIDELFRHLSARTPFGIVDDDDLRALVSQIEEGARLEQNQANISASIAAKYETRKSWPTKMECEFDSEPQPNFRPSIGQPRNPGTEICFEVFVDRVAYSALWSEIQALESRLQASLNERPDPGGDKLQAIDSFNSRAQLLADGSKVSYASIIWQLYGMVSLLSLLLIIIHVPTISVNTAQLFVGSFAMALLLSGPSAILFETGGLLNLYPFALLVVLYSVLKIIILAFQQNDDIEITKREVFLLGRKTLSKWWIIGFCGFLGLYASQRLDNYFAGIVYCIGQVHGECDPSNLHVVKDYDVEPDLEGDIQRSVAEHFNTAQIRLTELTNSTIKNLEGSAESSRDEIISQLFDTETAVFPKPLYDYYVPSLRPPPSCRWVLPDVKCFFERYIKRSINASYENTRDRQRGILHGRLFEVLSDAERTATSKAIAMANEIDRSFIAARNSMSSVIANAFQTLRVISLFFDFLLALALVKSFLTVFARLYFYEYPERYMAMESKMPEARVMSLDFEQERVFADIREGFGSKFEFSAYEDDFFVNRKFGVNHIAKDYSIPFMLSATLRRLKHGIFALNKVKKEDCKKAEMKFGAASEFVTWNVVEGEKIYVSPQNLVAFSGGLRPKTQINLRLISLAFDRMFFLTFSGAGTMIFKTMGPPEICPDKDGIAAFEVNQFAAWSATAQLGAMGDDTRRNIYMNSASVSVQNGKEGAVIDVGNNAAPRIGIIRFIPPALLPI
ncbi:hypothetical protein [Sulfitobacter sp.]|uniref:hypothetical protein n=1 Tax=Sulfitobacter sp. TaxID=1903071 RepID=UPI003003279A